MIISKTPLRISFAGGGTDLPSYYKLNDYGAVLSSSIDAYIFVTVKKHGELFPERFRFNYSETQQTSDIEKIENPIIRECLRFMGVDDSLYISTIADAPGSSGLGSSSSFCVGLLNALYAYKGLRVSVGRLAEEAAHIEIDVLKRPMGKQDHFAAAFGGLNYICFNADDTVTLKPVITKHKVVEQLFSNMLSFWTGVSRPSESILKEQDKNNSKNSEILGEMRDQADKMLSMLYSDVLCIEAFGKLLDQGWKLKRKLASKISNPSIDELYTVALDNGGIGGKLSGAGGGGFLNVVAAPNYHEQITKALEARGMKKCVFNFDSNGTQVMSIS